MPLVKSYTFIYCYFPLAGTIPVFRVLSKYIISLIHKLCHTISPWVQVLFLLIYYSKTLLSFLYSNTMNGFVVVNLWELFGTMGRSSEQVQVGLRDEGDTEESIGLRPMNEPLKPQHWDLISFTAWIHDSLSPGILMKGVGNRAGAQGCSGFKTHL